MKANKTPDHTISRHASSAWLLSPITGEMRIESENAAIGMKFTQSHQAGVR